MAWLDALSHWPVAGALRQWVAAYALVNAAHILGIALVVGAIATLDLRLLGAFPRRSLAELAPPLSQVATVGLALAILTGFLLFTVRPVAYAENPAFLAKLALVLLGVSNAIWLRFGPEWRAVRAGGPVSLRVKAGAGLSLACWVGALVSGRWIGFLQ